MDEKQKTIQERLPPNHRVKKTPVIESYSSWAQKTKGSSALRKDIDNKDNLIEVENLYRAAVNIVAETRTVSISAIQRRLGIRYTKAEQIVDLMEKEGVVSEMNGSGARTVLVEAALGKRRGTSRARKSSRRSRR